MWVYVLYGSRSESTARIARSIASAVEWSNEHGARPVSEVRPSEVRGPGLVFLGCASGGSELDRTIRHFLDGLTDRTMYQLNWAVFDSRTDRVPAIAGSGVRRLRRAVEHRGGRLVLAPESFFSNEPDGEVPHHELERARSWGSTAIAASVRIYRDPAVRAGALSGGTTRPAWELSCGTSSWAAEHHPDLTASGPVHVASAPRPLRLVQ